MNSNAHQFVVGQLYNRRKDIHDKFSGQSQGGISTPKSAPLIFLFTGESGNAFGYEDSFHPDGTYWYTGEGQTGDMQFVRGNVAIANHKEERKQILLFESPSKEQSHYLGKNKIRYLGEVECLGYHKAQSPDSKMNLREIIIFHLGFIPVTPISSQPKVEIEKLQYGKNSINIKEKTC